MAESLPVMRILPAGEAARWDELISRLPGTHFLQTMEWARVKAPVGWKPLMAVWEFGGETQAAALVLIRAMRIAGIEMPVRVMYSPRGPLLDWTNLTLRRKVIADLQDLARRQRAIFLKVDPEVILGSGAPGTPDDCPDLIGHTVERELSSNGWRYSADQIQFRNTVMIDLTGPEEDLLSRMKQKTRYNIRLAEKKGVQVSPAGLEDLHTLYQMYAETSVRDGFVIRDEKYYHRVWSSFMQAGMAEPLIARVEGETVAGLVIFRFGRRAWYVYGMSREVHRDKMPNYLLQGEAMRRAKAAGCREYDLWGAPETFDESDSMWGVYRFKEGLGGQVRRTLGAWDYTPRPGLYQLYTQTLPRILDFMRRRCRKRTAQEVTSL